MKPLETERLLLTGWKISDAPSLFEYAKNPNVGPAAGWRPHSTILDSLWLIVSFLIPGQVRAIRPKENGRAIGTISFSPDKFRPGMRSMELGYSMSEEYWGRGLMTEAAKEMIRYGFEELRLDNICICTGPENKKSQNIIRKCGFTYEGTLRKAFLVYDGTVRDVMCHSLTKAEYYENKKALQNKK